MLRFIKTISILFLSGIGCFAAPSATSLLKIGEFVEGRVEVGSSQTYTISLREGDYVKATLNQNGASGEVLVLAPDGTRTRKVVADKSTTSFSFVADTTGDHTVRVTASDFRLRIDQVQTIADRMALGSPRIAYPVPAIEALQRDFPSPQAVERFWTSIAQSGTPLVTSLADDKSHQLVTFLWRGHTDTRNVVVLGSFQTRPLTHYLMDHIPNTDVWHLTVKLPAGARFVYSLSINDPLVEDGPRLAERLAMQQADPLNPKKSWNYTPGAGIHEYASMAELPGAPPQPWTAKRSGVPEGKLESTLFKSALLGNERTIAVYTPPGYRKDDPAADLVVVFDENAYIDRVPTPTILDNLIAEGRIRPTIAVLIANPSQETRIKELKPNTTFADFLATELIPWVRSHYHVTENPRRSVVAGSSLGGIAATYAAYRHPGIFSAVLCQSGSFWWAPDHQYGGEPVTETGWLAKQFIGSPKLPIRFYMDAGIFEVDYVGSGGAILEPSRQMRDVLLAKGYEVDYREFVSGHDYLNWRGTFADGLLTLLAEHQRAHR